MGRGLAHLFARAGHEIILGSRDPARAQRVAQSIRRELAEARISGTGLEGAAQAGELVVLAVPFSAAGPILKNLDSALDAKALDAKIMVDITNPFGVVPIAYLEGAPAPGRGEARQSRPLHGPARCDSVEPGGHRA